MEGDLKNIYASARKEGLREQSRFKARGWNSHVPVLDSLMSRDEILNEVSLGLMEVPISKIKGTKTAGRSSALAPNFMPVLDEDTEFAAKWETLYASHELEGIRDPIKVYEYLNWFYVEEGNKRVSVLKFSGAATVQAYVTRFIPKYNEEDAVICLYYEFLEFYKNTGINYIWFRKKKVLSSCTNGWRKTDWIMKKDLKP